MIFFSRLFKPMPFLDAVMVGKVSHVRKHLDAGVNPNTLEDGTTYALHYAVHAGAETVGLLIRARCRCEYQKPARPWEIRTSPCGRWRPFGRGSSPREGWCGHQCH